MIDQHPTPTGTPIGYAVIGDETGGYGYPTPARTYLVCDEAGPEYGPDAQRSAAQEVARVLNTRDAGTDQGWCVVALVPVN